jgi:hypothetical protein
MKFTGSEAERIVAALFGALLLVVQLPESVLVLGAEDSGYRNGRRLSASQRRHICL